MGSLKPGATYIYEKTDGITYAREFGSDPKTRKAIGWDVPNAANSEGQRELDDHNEWIKIRIEAKTNPTLQKEVDRVKMLYRLSKEKYE